MAVAFRMHVFIFSVAFFKKSFVAFLCGRSLFSVVFYMRAICWEAIGFYWWLRISECLVTIVENGTAKWGPSFFLSWDSGFD